MRFRIVGAIAALALTVSVGASAQSLGEIAVYHENVGWIGQAAADEAAAEILANTTAADISVVDMDGAAAWVAANTGDGDADVLFMFGYLPETIYEPANVEADGSLIEAFIEDGNVALNTADYIFYVTAGGGTNGDAGLKAITDSEFDCWTDNNLATPTADGATYTPSLAEFNSNRSLKRDQVEADANWEYVGVFAEGDLGTDPAIIRDVNNGGMVGVVMQVSDDTLPRGAVVTELFNNWLPAIFTTTAVDADGKMASTWAALKADR
ncbi:hypothetical protein HN371_29765 [Candidatus Poribacteria bacterium]|jgi:hypothetical protein|nr:hypothetical protein [Candidatus Poribacteria bacterium]MBT5531814.1 hypothetical protein [Candidatus Poribacteria bacterium]MBT5713236.1 hypothetical protein [Candidatus Poribacteria bacterium]MBT7807419.1 hypothetical protein [Candidatus Poribacteria bacterium]